MADTQRTIDIGMHIIGADGEKIGSVGGIVIDPLTGEIRAGVLHTGHLLGDNIMLPRESITAVNAEGVHVNFTNTEAHAMLDRHTGDSIDPPAGFFGSSGVYWAPRDVFIAHVGVEHGPESPLREPEGVYLSHGTLVVDRNGNKLGHIARFVGNGHGHIAGFPSNRAMFATISAISQPASSLKPPTSA